MDRLPRWVEEISVLWQLSMDGGPTHGYCSLVLPVRTEDGRSAVLKLGFPDEESEFEGLALQKWSGRGAVELLRADPHRRALLLERLSTTDLSDRWDIEACEIVAASYDRLHVPAPPQLRRLSGLCGPWAKRLGSEVGALLPRRYVQRAVGLLGDFAGDRATDGRLIHTDLHYANVLAGPHPGSTDAGPSPEEERWVVIDPKPLNGDPHYEVAPLLWNRTGELAGDLRVGIRRRLEAVVDTAGLDEDRARAWTLIRMLNNAYGATDRDWVSLCLAVAKAVAD